MPYHRVKSKDSGKKASRRAQTIAFPLSGFSVPFYFPAAFSYGFHHFHKTVTPPAESMTVRRGRKAMKVY